MGIKSQDFPQNQQNMGTNSVKPVCNTKQQTNRKFNQSFPNIPGNNSRCYINELELVEDSVSIPSNKFYHKDTTQITSRSISKNSSHCSVVAQSSMVSNSTRKVLSTT